MSAIKCFVGVALMVAVGCASTQANYDPASDRPLIDARPSASLSAAAQNSSATWSPRGGVVMYLGADEELPARLTLGAYTRPYESEEQRVELGLDVAPDTGGAAAENFYLSLKGDYTYFLGGGTLCLKAGGGGVFEFRGEQTYFLGLAEIGVGLWLPVNAQDDAFVADAMIQLPLGDANPAATLMITAGYEY